MVEIDKAAEFRRLKKQHDGEEDPVIIAQRFLNIFRQLHIFSAEKKEGFNKMLLELPPYIRGLFGSLPGGGILQEYVDDLAEKQGIEVGSHTSAAASVPAGMEEEVAKAKILATALAEAQAQTAQVNPTVVNADGTTATVIQAAPSKIELGNNFAQELGKILAAAMKENNQAAKEEIRSMVAALGETQLEVVKVLHNDNAARRQDSERLAVMLTQAQGQIAEMLTHPEEFGAGSETSKLIKMLADSQAQIAETLETIKDNGGNNADSAKLFELSQQQFIKAVDAINENGRQNSKAIAEAISESQQELAKLIVQQNNQRMAAAAQVEGDDIKINAADYLSQLNMIADKFSSAQGNNGKNIEKTVESLVKAQLDIYREVASRQAQELSSVISAALKESQEISNKNLIKALQNLPKTTIIEKTIPQPIFTTPFFAPAPGTAPQGSTQTAPAPEAAATPTPAADNTAPAENTEKTESALQEETLAEVSSYSESEPETVETTPESGSKENDEPAQTGTAAAEETAAAPEETSDEVVEETGAWTEPEAEKELSSTEDEPEVSFSENAEDILENSGLPAEEPSVTETAPAKKSKNRKSKELAEDNTFSAEFSSDLINGEPDVPEALDSFADTDSIDFDNGFPPAENIAAPTDESDDSLDELFNIGEEPNLTSEEINKPKKKKKKKKNKNKNREQADSQNIGDLAAMSDNSEEATEFSFDGLSEKSQSGSENFDLNLDEGGNLGYSPDADFVIDEAQDDNPEAAAGNNADALPVEFDWDDDKPVATPQDDYEALDQDILGEINQGGTFDFSADENPDNPETDLQAEETAAPQDSGDSVTNGWGESESDTVYNNSVQSEQALPDDGEWEWEYEEVPENEAGSEDVTAAENQNESWDWEYEEVPEEVAAAEEEIAADDQEWEYVEVPEDEASDDEEATAGSEGADQEWEWEYEEVPDDEADGDYEASNQNENPAGGQPASNW